MDADAKARLESLVLAWQEARAAGREADAAELCRDCPELLPSLQRRLEAQLKLEAFLQSLPATPTTSAPPATQEVPPSLPGLEIARELGRGGMGIVYRARQIGIDRAVAVKVLLDANVGSADQLARFRREARLLAQLRHPHIVRVYEAGLSQGWAFLVLELVEGGSLAERHPGRPWPLSLAAQLVRDLAVALQTAHEQGIIHRDLKPANILLTPGGTPKVTDFGLARRAQEQALTQTGEVLGTPAYMAPEQVAGSKDVGPAADLYSLGVILYELLAGRPPFQSASLLDLMLDVLHKAPLPPSAYQRGIPRDLEVICLRCLAKLPEGRYPTAGALAEDLQRFLDGLPLTGQVPGRLARLTRRVPWRAGLAGMALAGLLGVGLAVWQGVRAQPPSPVPEGSDQPAEVRLPGPPPVPKDPPEQPEPEPPAVVRQGPDRTLELEVKGGLSGAAFDHDGGVLGWVDREGVAWVADLDGGRPRRVLANHEQERVTALALAPSARRATLRTADGRLLIKDLLPKPFPPRPLLAQSTPLFALVAEGKTLASLSQQGRLHVWRGVLLTLQIDVPAPFEKPEQLALSADGQRLVVAGPGGALWACELGRTSPPEEWPGDAPVTALAFSPDGNTLAVGTHTGQVLLREWRSGARGAASPRGGPAPVRQLLFAPDGLSFVALGVAEIGVYDCPTGALRARLLTPGSGVCALGFSARGALLAATDDGKVRAWDSPAPSRPPRRWAPQQLAQRWQQLGADDGRMAYAALGDLLRSPEQAVALVEGRLPARQPSPPQREQVEALLAELDSIDRRTANRAAARLAGMGETALPLLCRALDRNPSPSVRKRVGDLLAEAWSRQPPAEKARRLRCVQLLELLATPHACQVLRLLERPEEPAWQRREALRALNRLHWRDIHAPISTP